MDAIDRGILEALQDDARMSRGDLGERVGLSVAAVHERVRKLERRGIIRGYGALLDPERIGCDLAAFVEVYIEHPKYEAEFLEEVGRMPEIQECHRVTGSATCLLKVRVPTREVLQTLILDRINSFQGVRQTETIVVLSTTKESPRIHLGNGEATGGE